jgi:hypothetical protein
MTTRVLSPGFSLISCWEKRAEPREAIAARFAIMIESLQKIDPIFAHWNVFKKELIPLETIGGRLAEELDQGPDKDEQGNPVASRGYSLPLFSRGQTKDRSFYLEFQAGSTYPRTFANLVNLGTHNGTIERSQNPDPSSISYDIFKPALLAMVEAWDPLFCIALPNALRAFIDFEVATYFHATWIQYLCPWLAALITPPESAIVERLSNGGIVMAATIEIFDVNNKAHMAVAEDIETAMASLNLIPWEERARGLV